MPEQVRHDVNNVIAIACKLLRTAYALVTKKQKYDAKFNVKNLQLAS